MSSDNICLIYKKKTSANGMFLHCSKEKKKWFYDGMVNKHTYRDNHMRACVHVVIVYYGNVLLKNVTTGTKIWRTE